MPVPAGSFELSWTVFDEPVDAAVGDVFEDPEAQAARTSNMATEASLRHVFAFFIVRPPPCGSDAENPIDLIQSPMG
jgi:hypothetical protein